MEDRDVSRRRGCRTPLNNSVDARIVVASSVALNITDDLSDLLALAGDLADVGQETPGLLLRFAGGVAFSLGDLRGLLPLEELALSLRPLDETFLLGGLGPPEAHTVRLDGQGDRRERGDDAQRGGQLVLQE